MGVIFFLSLLLIVCTCNIFCELLYTILYNSVILEYFLLIFFSSVNLLFILFKLPVGYYFDDPFILLKWFNSC